MSEKDKISGMKKPKMLYRDTLEKLARDRYDQKVAVIGIDPYEVNKSMLSADPKCLPAITYIDIINYLVCTKSAYTMDELKAFKSLESYNQFVNGWVNNVTSKDVNNKVLVTGRVRHSQRLNDTALKPWIICSRDGIVDCAHCDCMAGLGEVCSHVGALLFYVEQAYKISSQKTVTQEKAYWLLPSSIDRVPYSEIRDIDFTSADTKKKRLDCEMNGEGVPKRATLKLPDIPEPSLQNIQMFKQVLHSSDTKPAILSVSKDFQDSYIPEIMKDGNLPVCLLSLKQDKYNDMNKCAIQEVAEALFKKMEITKDQAKNAEYITKEQSQCKEWHALRIGRITASNMKSVCTSSAEKPSKTVVKSICGVSRFSNKATQWGCKHEKEALAAYSTKVKEQHVNVRVDRCGIFINPNFPHIGASPDATVKCDCCGEGLVEVKCPYCIKDDKITDRVDFLENGLLKRRHKYAYQIQTQMLVTEKDFCDFVVWTKSDLLVGRVTPDNDIHDEIKSKAEVFFVRVILPEILGNVFTKDWLKENATSENQGKSDSVLCTMDLNKSGSETENSNASEIICICRKPYCTDDNVIGCDNENCSYVWLHFECVNLKQVPKGKYFCPECRGSQVKKARH